MARKCKLSGKGPFVGNSVSFSHKRTKKIWLPNLQHKRLWVPEEKRFVRIRLSARALRTVSKNGLMSYLRAQGLTMKDVT